MQINDNGSFKITHQKFMKQKVKNERSTKVHLQKIF